MVANSHAHLMDFEQQPDVKQKDHIIVCVLRAVCSPRRRGHGSGSCPEALRKSRRTLLPGSGVARGSQFPARK